MNKKTLLWSSLAALLVVVTLIQFIPAEPVLIPARLPAEQREAHRVLPFEGIHNFRDLGGYPTLDGRHTRWGVLYRSGHLAEASRSDLTNLERLQLNTLVDFRSGAEKAEEPDRLPEPAGFQVLEIPTLDGGDNSVGDEILSLIETGDFDGFDPDTFMIEANRQFPSTFNSQYRQFMQAVIAADGAPVLWHCSAGKDRAGFAAAILLRALGVPEKVVLDDYMLSREYSLAARKKELLLMRLLKGEEAASKLAVLMGVERTWLEAAFEEIDQQYGNFDGYLREALELSAADIAALKTALLE